jgi:enamine deaminase RidA (YjgF/YER057c/UK114 family)
VGVKPPLLAAVSLLLASVVAAAPAPVPSRQAFTVADPRGDIAAVRVADAPLVFTGQVFAVAPGGDAAAQAEGGLRALDALLAARGGPGTAVVRLHAYVASDDAVPAVRAAVARRFAQEAPAFTLVRTPLVRPGALFAFEAVGLATRGTDRVEVAGDAAVLPAGAKLFISGQAEKGADPATAVRLTMAGLHRSLAHLGLEGADVVQVKVFLQPFASHADAGREVAASFGGGPVPPVVMMEWLSDLYTEIEVVVSARRRPAPSENITHAWLPWLTRSPRYCHVATVAAGTPLIFLSAIDGGSAAGPRAQMKAIFERIGSVLFEAGSSYRHLAKATYYLADPATRTLLGDIRGVYFDPLRPPSASALNVRSLGAPGRAATIELIAVPVK